MTLHKYGKIKPKRMHSCNKCFYFFIFRRSKSCCRFAVRVTASELDTDILVDQKESGTTRTGFSSPLTFRIKLDEIHQFSTF